MDVDPSKVVFTGTNLICWTALTVQTVEHTTNYFNSAFRNILKNAELPRIRFHDLRHTFATHATKGGVDPKALSGILGHINAGFTLNIYTHVTGDMQKNAAAIVGGMVKKLKLEDE